MLRVAFLLAVAAVPLLADVPRYGVFEQTLDWNSAPYANVWEQVTVFVTIRAPSGRTDKIGGFYYDTNTWKFRYAPSELGTYNWIATIADNFIGTLPGKFSGSFLSVPSANAGFVRRNPLNIFRWITSDGKPFYPIGFNDCVLRRKADGSRPFDLPTEPIRFFMDGPNASVVSTSTYFSIYGEPGAKFNVFRWGPNNCAVSMYAAIQPRNNIYLEDQGRKIDDMIQAARQSNVRIYQVLFGSNPPYPSQTTARQFYAIERYVKYMVDRYGAYVDFWELMNEATVDAAWYTEVIRYLRSIDPYQHPISTSFTQGRRPDLDIFSPHWYQTEDEFVSDLLTADNVLVWKQANKPIIVGEQGNAIVNWDPGSALRMRLRSWTAFFVEGALLFWNTPDRQDFAPGTGAANIYLGPVERKYIRILQTFAAGFDPLATPQALDVSNPGLVRGYALSGPSQYAAYLHAYTDHTNATSGITVTIDLPAPGTAIWLNPSNGAVLQTQAVPAGFQTLAAPPFITDIAFKTVAVSPADQVSTASFTLAPSVVTAGMPSTATVTLSGPAPPGGVSILITAQHPCCLLTPATIVIQAGQTSAQFTVNTVFTGQSYSGWITVAYNGVIQSANLTVR